MTQHEIDQIWEEMRTIRARVDRLYWALLIAALACGGPQIVQSIAGLS